MIDLHNHILHGLDDGAATLAESIDMARQFVAEGVVEIAATPHYDPDGTTQTPIDVVRRRVAELNGALSEAGIRLRVHPGTELYLTPEAPDLLNAGKISYLGNGSYVLVETSLISGERPLYLDEVAFQLQLTGAQVILAHPERYGYVQRNHTVLDALAERGVCMQLTAPALLGEYGAGVRQTAEKLLRRGTYTLAASDRHHPGPQRSLAALHARITDVAGEETAAALLIENPRRVLEGREVTPVSARPAVTPSFWSRLTGRNRSSA